MDTRPGLPARAHHVLRASAWLTALLLLLAAMLPTTMSVAEKWFVCKYVGTPGVDEVLQTGQNPISVSENAIPQDPVVPGTFFADEQGRSYVLVEDTGQPEPDPSLCPPPQAPTPTPTPTPTSAATPTPTPTPAGGVIADTEEPTLPPTDANLNVRSAGDQAWQLAVAALAGILAVAWTLRPKRVAVRRDR
jgi:hypothetical protein